MSEWIVIIKKLRKDELSAIEVQVTTRAFMGQFFACYDRKLVTPYMHIFSAHLHEFKQINGTINSFNIQGLEKLNDLTTSQFFRATNRRKTNKCKKRAPDVEIAAHDRNGGTIAANNDYNPFVNADSDADSVDEDEQNTDKIWIKQMIELRNRNDKQSFLKSNTL